VTISSACGERGGRVDGAVGAGSLGVGMEPPA
jgi:hypothetical protein